MIVSIEFFKTVWKQLINKINKLDDKINKVNDGISQSDWNTNDTKDPSYINNRICYATLTKKTILPETEFTATVHNDYYDYYVASDSNNAFNSEFYNNIKDEKNVDVIYDGIVYKNVSLSKEDAYVGGGMYITIVSIGKFNDTPFCIQVSETSSNNAIYFKTQGTHTVSITKPHLSYKKIDGNYLNLCKNYNDFSDDSHNSEKIVTNNLLTEHDNFIVNKYDNKYSTYYAYLYFSDNVNKFDFSDTFDDIISYLNNGRDVVLTYLNQIYIVNFKTSTSLSFINISSNNANDGYMIKSFELFNNSTRFPTVTEKDSIELSNNYVILNSSTSGSTKKFKITVDDTGTISATEVT